MVQRKLPASATQGHDALITDLKNKDVLQKLANDPAALEFVIKLTAEELESFIDITTWSPAILVKLRDNPDHLKVLHKMWNLIPSRDETFIRNFFEIYDHPTANKESVLDAFSQGQIDSKLWLINTLINLDQDLGKIWIMCGWIGSLGYLMFRKKIYLNFTSIRSFDIDPSCADLADILNRQEVKDGWKFKASTADVMDLLYDDHLWLTKKSDGSMERDFGSADTIINTSCEHLRDFDDWYARIPKGKLVVLQSNNNQDYLGHVGSMNSMYELAARAPCSRVHYKGVLDCGEYERYMLIGRR
jgi:hypothetical protein